MKGVCTPISAFAIYILSISPGPSARDVAQRSERQPMTAEHRRRFLSRYWVGLMPLLLAYATLMTFRSLRDYFASTIYSSVLAHSNGGNHTPGGADVSPGVYLLADWPAGILACMTTAAVGRIQNSRKALLVFHAISIAGAAILGIVALLYKIKAIGGTFGKPRHVLMVL